VPAPTVVAVSPDSAAARAGLEPGDQILSIGGEVPRDVIQWQLLVDEADLELEISRGGLERPVDVPKRAGEPLGAEVDAALFDQVRTCDNHCEFCFIYQLPKGMRRSLYVKDDDYRLSFLYGNFTTLTRFTEADLERVVTEVLSPLYVSIHSTDPQLRARMLRNPRGAVSLRWLRVLLDHGIEVHGQVVVCPGVNDGDALEDTLCGVADEYPELASLAVVPLGVSRYSGEAAMRPHSAAEAAVVVDLVGEWQALFTAALGRPLVHAADEYYLLCDRPFPAADSYGDFDMLEDGIGMARAFEAEFLGRSAGPAGSADAPVSAPVAGFFASVDGAPAVGYRAPRHGPNPGGCTVEVGPIDRGDGGVVEGWAAEGDGVDIGVTSPDVPDIRPSSLRASVPVAMGVRRDAPVGLLTGAYGARVLEPLVAGLGRDDVRVLAVDNLFFGGNIGVTGLLVGADVARVLAGQPAGHRYLLPDVCLSSGRFLDGTTVDDLPQPVEVVATDGRSLRNALQDRALRERA
jgi:putative radical SAM enzyme (TIGR03279 family)